MDERKAFWLWYDFRQIAGSAINRQKSVDGDNFETDWERQQQAMLLASLGLACSLLETIGRKGTTDHTRVLAHLRNALLHNGGDISKNRGAPGPQNECEDYLKRKRWTEFGPHQQYFTISKTNDIQLSPTLYFFIERMFDSFLSTAQIALGAPIPDH